MTDSIQAQAQNKYLIKRWCELTETRQETSKTGDEIAIDVISRLNLRVKGGE